MIETSGSIALINGSGSVFRKPENMWIRIRIQEARKHVDPDWFGGSKNFLISRCDFANSVTRKSLQFSEERRLFCNFFVLILRDTPLPILSPFRKLANHFPIDLMASIVILFGADQQHRGDLSTPQGRPRFQPDRWRTVSFSCFSGSVCVFGPPGSTWDPLVTSTDLAPEPSVLKQKNSKKNLDFYCFLTSL